MTLCYFLIRLLTILNRIIIPNNWFRYRKEQRIEVK
jgi:hypothetical protein